ncbi:exopolysaccharide biosynthesis protein [Paenibacillus selenitireducens]|jgi:pyruvyl transferase EpsO|uniref:Exopolysaccharide biosynthesis protein n=1 Tax=Paenibacillus selenitireducens TaxID=1324314 RepID=A0A1T2XJN9_9BACL|nr:polysaccharide pyruvyl transferase family protein [Paenibacillus selenitireducens]OPA80028.1 exopolysaccharide biosynthesis protein [Paenibacillus selenitireducens]
MREKPNMHPMDALKKRLRLILNVIPSGSSIYYIDYPVYNNGGDLLIMKGAEAFFRDNNIHVQARYSVLDFPEKLMIPKDQIIVLQGGGNFGDLYPVHQKLREKIVAEYPDNRIVLLPQTIFYKEESEYDRTAELFNKHRDAHLFVRDTLTYELAIQKFHGCGVYLCPDMAHQLWPISPTSSPGKERLCFFRTDIEKTKDQLQFESDGKGDFLDWASLYNRVEKKSIKMIAGVMKKGSGPLPMHTIWDKYSDYLVNKAVKRFSDYRNIQTSRLHGHILACLMDKPNMLLDNSYGKNSNYYNTWTSGIETAQLVVSTPKMARRNEEATLKKTKLMLSK